MFSEDELAYLKSQRLARIATVNAAGQPTNDAVGFEFDGARFLVGGHAVANTRKYKNVVAGNALVSLIVDDLASVDPWSPRGIRVHGQAEIVRHQGYAGPGEYLAITPTVTWSWGLGRQGGSFKAHKVVWDTPRASQTPP